ncbi:MAG: TolC family protein, partial [Bacteroidia bacterium]|nr:TolC family protein [Bacteroidia bacterium]
FGQSKLNDYLEFAVRNNPGLKASYAEFEASLQKIPQVSSLEDPNFRVSSFGQMVETRTGQQMARFTLEQMFPWFGTLGEQKNVAALNAEAMFESYKSERNELILKVKDAYYPIYELDQAIRLNEENLKLLETFKSLATSKFRNGKGKLSDALRVDIMTNEINTEVSILREKKKPLITTFNKLLNRDETDEVEVISPLEIVEPTINKDSLINNPRLEALRKKVMASEALERVAVKQSMPKFGVGFEYIITQKRPEISFSDNGKDAYMAMFSVSLPIYRTKYKAAIKETQLMQTSFTELQKEVENNLIAEYEMSIFEVESNRKQLTLYHKQVERTKQIVNLLLSAYSNDESDFEEILTVQQMLLKYQMMEVTAIKEYHLAIAKLDYLVAH